MGNTLTNRLFVNVLPTLLMTQTMRLAFVVQRYGTEVTGGAESLCRWVAERMHTYFEVEILSTCAIDYLTWENYFAAGNTLVNSVVVRRFPVDTPRDMQQFNACARRLFANEQRSLVDELTWIRLQGPFSSELLSFIRDYEHKYDLFLFVTYSYLTTFLGLQLVPRKSILIPAAHDEPHFHLDLFRPLFHLPQGIIYNTAEEKRLVHERWQNEQIPWCIAGAGVGDAEERGQGVRENCPDFPTPYLLYVGRIDVMKGCEELLSYFRRYRNERNTNLHLVLIGKQTMDIPEDPDIHAPGFLSSARKDEAMRRAAVVVNPSEYESLSLLILEAWQQGTCVLVNGRSDVLAEHCLSSNGGVYYTNYEEFALCLDLLLANPELRTKMSANGKHYVEQHYAWDRVEKTYVDFIQYLTNFPSAPVTTTNEERHEFETLRAHLR